MDHLPKKSRNHDGVTVTVLVLGFSIEEGRLVCRLMSESIRTITLLKLAATATPLKNGGREAAFSLGISIFRCELLVAGMVIFLEVDRWCLSRDIPGYIDSPSFCPRNLRVLLIPFSKLHYNVSQGISTHF